MDFGDLTENPFALATDQARPRAALRLRTAVKTLLLVSLGLAATVLISTESQRWLLHRYTHDFEQLDSPRKRQRLFQIAALGSRGINPLVSAMADSDVEVARTAYELLGEAQNGWTVMPTEKANRHHAQLVASLRSVAPRLPDDRTGWGIQLLQQTVQRAVDRNDVESIALYDRANEVVQRLSLSQRSGPSILETAENPPETPRRLKVRSEPLPVQQVEPQGSWTQWPPQRDAVDNNQAAENRVAALRTNLNDPPSESSAVNTAEAPVPPDGGTPVNRNRSRVPSGSEIDQNDDNRAPALYRSSGMDAAGSNEANGGVNQLRSVPAGEAVVLKDIDAEVGEVRSVSHLAEVPMTTLDDRSVMHWLGSDQELLRQKAISEMKRRGYSDSEVHVASRIASGTAATRIELATHIAHLDEIDPRPWLLMMLRDQNRDVKLTAISVLATFDDPSIRDRLREHLASEQDPRVASRIRKILMR